MKLLKRLNITFLFTSLIVMVCLGTTLTIVLQYVIKDESNDLLEQSFRRIKSQIQGGEKVSTFWPYFEIDTVPYHTDDKVYTEVWIKSYKGPKEVGRYGKKSFKSFSQEESKDRKYHDKPQKRVHPPKEEPKFDSDDQKGRQNQELFSQLTAYTTIRSVTYRIIVRSSQLDSDDFNESVIIVVLLGLGLIFILIYFVNRKISSNIWHDFYLNLAEIKQFSIQKQQPIALRKSNITEFNELNSSIFNLTNKVCSDYKNLKQFSEDASHELQTPLAIIRSKLESLINSNELNDTQLEKLDVIYKTINRLTRLNNDLLLLTKVENNQFEKTEKLNFNAIVEDKIVEWQEIVALKNIDITTEFNGDFEVFMNPFLADIVMSNLLSNAINHTQNGGAIVISISKSKALFSNSGIGIIANHETIFNRFHKENTSSKSVGLGLAIVKKICEASNLTIDYHFEASMHCFEIADNTEVDMFD